MSQPKRLAITISGAVSLGSYEAGVLFEIFAALERHNTDPATLPADKVVIDVLCGASAGGMTAAIASQVLLDARGRLRTARDNAFYNPWVAEADITTFLKDTPGEDLPEIALLATSQVRKIAETHLLDTIAPDAVPHPAAAPSIRLGLALSNLHGVDYKRETIGALGRREDFIYTRFQDEFLREVRIDGRPNSALDWSEVRKAALACGAFPFAFSPRDITRPITDYATQHTGFDASQFDNLPERQFTYVDGGLFHNEPLGIARDQVAALAPDGRPDDPDTRFYLFVSPDAKSSKRPEKKPATDKPDLAAPGATSARSDKKPPARITADTETLPLLTGHLLNAIFTQGRFQDWIMASKVNRRIHQLDTVAAAIADSLLAAPPAAPDLPAALATVADAFLPAFFAGSANPRGDLDAELIRLRRTYTGFGASPDVPGIPPVADYLTRLSPAAQEIWLKAVLLFEKTAKLEKKELMTIFTITASESELAGNPLFSFAGFLSREARDHDYQVGRHKAQQWLIANANATGPLPMPAALEFGTSLVPMPVPSRGGMQLSETPLSSRQALRTRLISRGSGAFGKWKWLVWIPLQIVVTKFLEIKNPPRRGPRR